MRGTARPGFSRVAGAAASQRPDVTHGSGECLGSGYVDVNVDYL
jgi:hypothetical protein